MKGSWLARVLFSMRKTKAGNSNSNSTHIVEIHILQYFRFLKALFVPHDTTGPLPQACCIVPYCKNSWFSTTPPEVSLKGDFFGCPDHVILPP